MSASCIIAIYASGSGSNAEAIVAHLATHPVAQVAVILTNNPQAGVIARAARLGIPLVETAPHGDDAETQLAVLRQYGVQLVVLAGWLRQIPEDVLAAFPKRIINIHPALLPQHGGKGMYGNRVHQAVLDAGDAETGITIHYVDVEYDRGEIIRQVRVPVPTGATAAQVQELVHALEHKHYSQVIAELAQRISGGVDLPAGKYHHP